MIAFLDLNKGRLLGSIGGLLLSPTTMHLAISSRFDGGLGGFNPPSKIFDPSVTRLKHFTITDKLTSQPPSEILINRPLQVGK